MYFTIFYRIFTLFFFLQPDSDESVIQKLFRPHSEEGQVHTLDDLLKCTVPLLGKILQCIREVERVNSFIYRPLCCVGCNSVVPRYHQHLVSYSHLHWKPVIDTYIPFHSLKVGDMDHKAVSIVGPVLVMYRLNIE